MSGDNATRTLSPIESAQVAAERALRELMSRCGVLGVNYKPGRDQLVESIRLASADLMACMVTLGEVESPTADETEDDHGQELPVVG